MKGMPAWLQHLFRRRWETVYMTFDLKDFASARGRLMDHGIRTKTFTTSTPASLTGHTRGPSSYEIKVKVEDVAGAHSIIHERH